MKKMQAIIILVSILFYGVAFAATTDLKTGAESTFHVPLYDPSGSGTDAYGRYTLSDVVTNVVSPSIPVSGTDFDPVGTDNSTDELTADELAAINGAASPASDNVFATMADVAGDVSKVGTPVDNQVGVWTGDGTIEGTTGLTYNGSTFAITGNLTLTGTVDGIDIATDVAANTLKTPTCQPRYLPAQLMLPHTA